MPARRQRFPPGSTREVLIMSKTTLRQVRKTTIRKVGREWVVRAYDQYGKRFPDADYFTTNEEDAEKTA